MAERGFLVRDERGATAPEYASIVALVAVVSIGSWNLLGEGVQDCTESAAGAIAGDGATGDGPCVGTGPRPPKPEGTEVASERLQSETEKWEAYGDYWTARTGQRGDGVSAKQLGRAFENPDRLVARSRPQPGTVASNRAQRERSQPLAEALVQTGGSGTAATERWVEDRVAGQIPAPLLQILIDRGIQIRVGVGSVANVLPELANVRPDGYPRGTTWRDVQGAFVDSENAVIIGVNVGSGGRISMPSDFMIAHEIAHALDDSLGLSGDPKFLEALRNDLEAAQLQGGNLNRYLRDPREAFAEIVAHYLNNDAAYAKIYSYVYSWLAQSDPLRIGKRKITTRK